MTSFNQSIKRIGFACIWAELDKKGKIVSVPELNITGTTVSWLNNQSQHIAEEKLWNLLKFNIEAVRKLVARVGTLDRGLRMVRLGSDILPVYTHPDWKFFYRLSDVRTYCEKAFRQVGDLAREKDVRLSFHPGQFCCIVSDNPGIVDRSIEELEYHADMIRWMGFGQSKLDFKLNIHLSGRRGVTGFDDAWTKMSPELKNCLTLENDEYQKGLDDLLILKDKVGIVLDIHHHLIKENEYIQSTDSRIEQIKESWRGIRPTMHYSVSREDVLEGHDIFVKPDFKRLLESGKNKQKLRAHSDFYWNEATNLWAIQFHENFDIMCESKAKNLSSFQLYENFVKPKYTTHKE